MPPHTTSLPGVALEEVAQSVARTGGGVHQPSAPLFTPEERARLGLESEYGGCGGTLSPSALSRVLRKLNMPPGSKFCDIGCGSGAVTLTVAHYDLGSEGASWGFDVDPALVTAACTSYERVNPPGETPVLFFREDAFALWSLTPVTHAYAFAAYPKFIKQIALLAARSGTLKKLAVVFLREEDVIEAGLTEKGSPDIMHGLKMPSGMSYSGVVVRMTANRRARIMQDQAASQGVGRNLEVRVLTKDQSARAMQEQVESAMRGDHPERKRQRSG